MRISKFVCLYRLFWRTSQMNLKKGLKEHLRELYLEKLTNGTFLWELDPVTASLCRGTLDFACAANYLIHQ